MGEHDFWDNPEKAQQIIASLKPLNGLLKPYEELSTVKDDLVVMAELAAEDTASKPSSPSELARFEKRFDEFELQAMMSGPQDASNAFLRIQAGTGGTEACDWAQMLLRMYTRWAERHGYKVELIDELRNDEAGIRSATLRIIGDYAYGYLQSEVGVHRLVRISPFDSNATRQTVVRRRRCHCRTSKARSTIEIKPDDLRDATPSAAAAPAASTRTRPSPASATPTIPTGIAAESRTERSQHKNDANAMEAPQGQALQARGAETPGRGREAYDEKGEVAWGNQIRNYVMQPYTLVKDVRTGTETAQVQNVLDGDIDEFMEDYLKMMMIRKRNKKSG